MAVQQKVGMAVEEYTSFTTNGVNVRAGRLIHQDRSSMEE